MDYLDIIDNMSLEELFGFLEYRNSYKDMMESYENIVAESEARYEYEREEEQLRYLEEKESK